MRIFVALRHVILGVEVYQHLKLFSLNISIFIQHFFWFWFFFSRFLFRVCLVAIQKSFFKYVHFFSKVLALHLSHTVCIAGLPNLNKSTK
jgi:hypothetical protein